jgi:hypothetical protein
VTRVVPIALLLALLLGHGMPTLCGVWCVEEPPSASQCRHGEASGTLALVRAGDCRTIAPAIIAPAYRGLSAQLASAAQPLDLAPAQERLSAHRPAAVVSPPNLLIRPRVTALRI